MIKLIVFAVLLAVVSSFPTEFEGIPNLLDVKDESTVCKEEIAKFKSCFKDDEKNVLVPTAVLGGDREEVLKISEKLKKGFECLGEVTCNKLIFLKFGGESAVFGMEKLFNDGYECTSQINFQSDLMGCVISEVNMDELSKGGFSVLGAHVRPIARCFAKKPKCGDVPRKALLQGSLALADFVGDIIRVLEDAQKHSLETLNSFNKKFNPSNYDNVEL